MSRTLTPARRNLIAKMDAKLKPPTEDELKTLRQEHHCESWGEYICMMADDYGASAQGAFNLFDMLGENEAFDGFVTDLEDLAESEGDDDEGEEERDEADES